MRAHTITTTALVGARARTTRTIVALSLAVAFVAATATTAGAERSLGPTSVDYGNRQSGTTNPPPPPLTLDLDKAGLEQGVKFAQEVRRFWATTNHDSTLVVGFRKGPPVVELAAGIKTKIKVNLKRPMLKKLRRDKHGRPVAEIKVEATDEFGQTVTDEIKVKLHRAFCPRCPRTTRCGPRSEPRPCARASSPRGPSWSR